MTYWAEFYILQQILNKELHNTDTECANYAVQLMDKLEQKKSENASNDAFVDDMAAKAYIENFALETFKRADEAQRENKVTKQTADTFMAAATFLDMLAIWGDLDKEAATKSKFAKFHALRIAKAFKAGEDPNATNPVVEEPPAPAEDRLDAELKDLERQESGQQGVVYQSPTVQNEDHSGMTPGPETMYQRATAAPPPLPQQTPVDLESPRDVHLHNDKVSPIEPPEIANARQNSIGGGYFPATSPAPPPDEKMKDYQQDAYSPQPPVDPQDFYNVASQPPAAPPAATPDSPPPHSFGMSSPTWPQQPRADPSRAQPPAVTPMQSPPVPQIPVQAPRAAPIPAPAPVQQAQPVAPYRTDDESTMAAQKHARWAISALNFEDANTAVKELRLALQSLGAG